MGGVPVLIRLWGAGRTNVVLPWSLNSYIYIYILNGIYISGDEAFISVHFNDDESQWHDIQMERSNQIVKTNALKC